MPINKEKIFDTRHQEDEGAYYDRLLKNIIEELDPSDFTLNDLQEAFNNLADRKPSGFYYKFTYDQDNIDYLVREGLIQDLEGRSGHYEVTEEGHKYQEMKDVDTIEGEE